MTDSTGKPIRYDLEYSNRQFDPERYMVERLEGDWIKAESYDETAVERDRLKEFNARLIDVLEFVHKYHHMQIKRGTGAFPSQLIESIDKALAKARTMITTEGN